MSIVTTKISEKLFRKEKPALSAGFIRTVAYKKTAHDNNAPWHYGLLTGKSFYVQIAGKIGKRNLSQLVLHCSLGGEKFVVQHGVDVFSHGTGGIGIFVEMEKVPVHTVHGSIYVVKCDVFEILDYPRSAAARLDFYHACGFERQKRTPYDDGIHVYALGDKLRSRTRLVPEKVYDEQCMHRYRKSRRDLHMLTPFVSLYPARNVMSIVTTPVYDIYCKAARIFESANISARDK